MPSAGPTAVEIVNNESRDNVISGYVIEEGAVAEAGRHEELLRKGGRYASFYRLQLQNEEPPRAEAAIAAG